MATDRCASPDERYTEQERRNRDAVLEFYDSALNRRDYAAACRHLGPHYIEHNPNVSDGPEGLREHLASIERQFPKFRVEINRVFVEGDMVAVHARSFNGPTRNGEAGVDIFRLEGGRIVEHWDVVQPIPDSIPHQNTMF
ncbi:MAG TPA: nuclear transport factor 2 family protein [Steroidobacteraceae bacterium]|nr:nuclear transport factor 2 family protein [Steroidobacteraceae bacterium]